MYIVAKDIENGTTLIASSCMSERSFEAECDSLLEDNGHVFKVRGKQGVMMVADCVSAISDLLRYNKLYEGDLSYEAVVKYVLKAIRGAHAFYGLPGINPASSKYVIADKDHLFDIHCSGCVSEREFVTSQNSLDGAFLSAKGDTVTDKILNAFRANEPVVRRRIFPICIYDVATGKRKIYKK